MGKSDVKLQRVLSLPNNLALCEINEFSTVMTIDKDRTDTDKILVRQNSVVLQVRSNLSSGTSTEKLPEGLFKSLCTSDTHPRDIRRIKSLNRYISDSEMVRNMPALRDVRNRRTALGYIFQDTNPEDLDNLLSVFDNRTNSETTENMQNSTKISHQRRAGLGDIFQGLDDEDFEHLISLCEHTCTGVEQNFEVGVETCFRRRPALPDIFENVSEEQLSILVNKCCEDIEEMDSFEMNQYEMPRRCRRFAKGNIFSDVNEDDLRRMFPSYETERNFLPQTERGHSCGRRLALGDIFNGVSEDDVLRIMSHCEIETNKEDLDYGEGSTDRLKCVNNRRDALGNIFKDVDQEELRRVLSNFCYD